MSTNHTKIDHLLDENKNQKKPEFVSYSVESEPIPARSEIKSEAKIDVVETEPNIEDKELEKFIKVEKHKIELDPALKKAGLQVIDASTIDPRHNVKLPITDENIVAGLNKPVNSSWRWLAEIAVFMLRRAHISLKKIHGHIVRVIKK